MQYILAVQYSQSEEQLSEPVADDLLAESLVVFAQHFEVGGEIALCIGCLLHSQYSIIIMSSFSILKNSS